MNVLFWRLVAEADENAYHTIKTAGGIFPGTAKYYLAASYTEGALKKFDEFGPKKLFQNIGLLMIFTS